jgi:hypothetical protein
MPNGEWVPVPHPAEALNDQVLLEVVRGHSQATGSREALRVLLERQPERPRLLAELVTDLRYSPDLRAAAAVALGRHPSPTGERALIDALAAPDPAVVRRAAEALGRTAGPEVLPRLEAVTPSRGPARRSVEFARTLLSYRHGLEHHRLQRPPERSLLTVDARQAISGTTTALRPSAVVPILEDVREELAGIPLSDRGALRFTCGEHVFAIVLSRHMAGLDRLDTLTRRSTVVGAVLELSSVTDRYFLSEYLLASPALRGSGVWLFGVRSSGTIIHVGDLQPTGQFEVRATDTRSSPPVAIDGLYDPTRKQLQINRMLTHPDFVPTQRQPREPRRLDDADVSEG